MPGSLGQIYELCGVELSWEPGVKICFCEEIPGERLEVMWISGHERGSGTLSRPRA
jgi:hypothetical protein